MPWNFVELVWGFLRFCWGFCALRWLWPSPASSSPSSSPSPTTSCSPPSTREALSDLVSVDSQLVSIGLNWSQSQSWCREHLVLSDSPLNSTIIQVCVDTTFQLLHFKKYLEIFRLLEYPILPPPARPIRHKCHNKTGTKRGIIDPLVSKQPEFVVWNNFFLPKTI